MHSVRQIEIVRALAKHRHFGLAAKALGVSQPALTRSLKQIDLAGTAIGAAIPSQIEQELKEGLCAVLPVQALWLTLNYGFILKRGRTPSPAAKAFMEIVREIEAGITR